MSDKRKGNKIRYTYVLKLDFSDMKKMAKEIRFFRLLSRQTAQDRLHCQTSQPTLVPLVRC